jgi:hypothetical protein
LGAGIFLFLGGWFPLCVLVGSRYLLFSLFWPLHFKRPFEAKQECSPSC